MNTNVTKSYVLVPTEPHDIQLWAAIDELGWCEEDREAARKNPRDELMELRVTYSAMVAAIPATQGVMEEIVMRVCAAVWDAFGHQWPSNIGGVIDHVTFKAVMRHSLEAAISTPVVPDETDWHAEYRVAQQHAEEIDDLCVANARALFRALHPGHAWDHIEREQSHDITCEAIAAIGRTADHAEEPGLDLSAFDGHTPGPWQMSGARSLSPVYKGHGVGPDGKDYVVTVPYTDRFHHQCLANARLIAAAPLLLAELRRSKESHKGEQA